VSTELAFEAFYTYYED